MKRLHIAISATFLGASLFTHALPAQKAGPISPGASSQPQEPSPKAPAAAVPRGQKLMLKDGSFQLVREYQIQGDRVRYYSLDTSQWEEMPESLVDWDATKKAEAQQEQRDAAAIAQVKKQEQERNAEPLDIDASLEVAPDVFLPPGEGPFAFDGKAMLPLAQADMTSELNKGKAIEKVLVPVPLVPSRHMIYINGARAKVRIHYSQPEIYLRTKDGSEPEMLFVRAKLKGGSRQIEKVDELFGQEAATAETVPTQRWVIAPGVYRYTFPQPLDPGEYAMVKILKIEGGMNMYIWDFGIDPATLPVKLK